MVLKAFLPLASLAIVTVAFPLEAFSIPLVVPSYLAQNESAGNNAAPVKFGGRYQQVYNASEFAELSDILSITGLAFRPDSVAGDPFAFTYKDVKISLSTTSKAADTLDGVFANNLGSDNTLVHDGPLSLSSAFAGPARGPKDFDIKVGFTHDFNYIPKKGNLLLDITVFEMAFPVPVFDATDMNAFGDSVSRRYSDDPNSTSSLGSPIDFSYTLGLVTQFQVEKAGTDVPEPPTIWLSAIALFLLAIRTVRKTRTA